MLSKENADEKSKEISSAFAIIEKVQVLSLDKARMTRLEYTFKRKKRLPTWGRARKGNEVMFMKNNVLCDVKVKRFGGSSYWILISSGEIRAG